MTWGFIRWVLLALLVVGLGAGAAFLSTVGDGEGEEEQAVLLPVRVVEIQPVSTFTQRRTFTGTLAARRASELSFERTEKLVQVFVDEGDRVQAGDRLAQLDLRSLQVRKREVQAQRAEAQAVLEELVVGPREEKKDVARAEVKALEAQIARLETDFRRNRKLLNARAMAYERYDRTRQELATTKANLEAARRRLDELETGTRKERLQAQRAAVERLDAMLASIQVDMEDSTLTAPFAGRIARRYVDEGTIVAPNQQILRLVEDHKLEARIGIPARLTGELQPGETQTVRVDNKLHAARVRSILPELNLTTRTRTVLLDVLPRSPQELAPGQIVRVDLQEEKVVSGYWLPTSALTRSVGGLWSAYVVEREGQKQMLQRRVVEVLYTQGEQSLVRGTLTPREWVVVAGAHRVVPGQRVLAQLVNENPDAGANR